MSLDRQLQKLPKEVIFCKNCVVSNQRPRTEFNERGICSACEWSYEKDHVVDWEKRYDELKNLCDKYRSGNGSFDVVVPGSGGKDSGFVAHQLKNRFGMNPLCVTWAPFEWTNIGFNNLNAFVHSGFNNIIAQPDQKIHRKLSRLAFDLLGDAWEPFAYGQKSLGFNIAEKFNIKLIFFGENGELEYGGNTKYKNKPKEGPEEWKNYYYKGSTIDELVNAGIKSGLFDESEIKEKTLDWYKAPKSETIEQKQIEMHWYSYYVKWTPQENYYYSVKHTGLESNDEGRSESTYTKYSSLDDKMDGFHWYLSYMKFGMGRCSREAQQDIRRHHITREEGVRLVKLYDHEFPKKHFDWMLKYLDISKEDFWLGMDYWREQSNVWVKKNGDWVMNFPVL